MNRRKNALAVAVLFVVAGCHRASATTQASSATPDVPPAPSASAVAPSAGSAKNDVAAENAPAGPSFAPHETADGVHVDHPAGFALDPKSGGTVFANDQGGKLTLLAMGTCGRSMADICRPANAEESKWTRQATKTTCFATGHRGDNIVWSRDRLVDDVVYSIIMSYPATEKTAYDPIVEHVSKSWTVPPKATAGYYCGRPQ